MKHLRTLRQFQRVQYMCNWNTRKRRKRKLKTRNIYSGIAENIPKSMTDTKPTTQEAG